jgi:formamidopyrimidine-DNA glycosylase
MPELPEVETVARGLQQSVAGRRILSVVLGKTDFIDDALAIESELPGSQIERVERYGKFMLLRLANSADSEKASAPTRALLVHLGMTGNLAPHHPGQPVAKHTHVTLALDDGRELRYIDPRRFGRMAFLSGEALRRELSRFGAEPLLVDAQEFTRRILASKARVKALLLDQRVLRGVGNIYADESLWAAKIHPARTGASLKPAEAQSLRKALQKILLHAINKRGSSISDFVDGNGNAGEYQRYHKVYGRDGQRCFRCGAEIRWMVVAGRSSHFCPFCQRAPRKPRRARKQKGAKPKHPVGTSKR